MSHQLLQEEQITPRRALPYRRVHEKGSTDSVAGVPRASRRPRARPDTKLPTKTSPPPGRPPGGRHHWLFFGGIGMLLTLTVVVLGQITLSRISLTWDDLHYGRPRTSQIDAFVGHETTGVPSHFVALNLHGRIEIVEFPGSDAMHACVSLGRNSMETLLTWCR
jgi:hypothetical protein